jgi:RPA family protein
MVCRLLFLSGTLTEKEQSSGDYFYGRVADPTGVFELRKIRPDAGLQAVISGIDAPRFVTVIGQARMNTACANPVPYIELLEIREVDRPTRDIWIVRTAELTFDRLFEMKNALENGTGNAQFLQAISDFHINAASIGKLAEMACHALDQVAEISVNEGIKPEVKEKVLLIIRESAGKKGISLDELIRLAGESGIDETEAREAIRTLLEEDECYQPARNVYKPL